MVEQYGPAERDNPSSKERAACVHPGTGRAGRRVSATRRPKSCTRSSLLPGLEAVVTGTDRHELMLRGVTLIPRSDWDRARPLAQPASTPQGERNHGQDSSSTHGPGPCHWRDLGQRLAVKLYKGVALGAMSFPRPRGGQIIRGMKADHPTLQDEWWSTQRNDTGRRHGDRQHAVSAERVDDEQSRTVNGWCRWRSRRCDRGAGTPRTW